ncbi:hypothetical protein LX32DRAFT_295569 [Colletotrichum zoysiae]|uniref:Uncharacterized protein n=1 Tax=Colletotrichum zoysiae TaxID=1216348 RepID=A0AAD9M3V0_9PEZI|nr:hypothetical protein LX32DRAFT_295569 [Colletotrichum zoysiae]
MRHRVELFVISSPAPLMPETLFLDKSGQLDGQIYPVIEVGGADECRLADPAFMWLAPFYLAQGMQRAASVRMEERRKCASRLAGRKPWNQPHRGDWPVSPSLAGRTYKEAQGAWDVLPKDQMLCLTGLGLNRPLPFHLELQIPPPPSNQWLGCFQCCFSERDFYCPDTFLFLFLCPPSHSFQVTLACSPLTGHFMH